MGTTANTGKSAAEAAAKRKASTPPAKLKDYVNWFEIPVYDLTRAKAFYDLVYGFTMETNFNGDHAMAFFPAGSGVGGACRGRAAYPRQRHCFTSMPAATWTACSAAWRSPVGAW